MFGTPAFPRDTSCPCFKCTKETGRTPTCKFDGTCKNKYPAWEAQHSEKQGEINRQRAIENAFYERGINIHDQQLKHPHAKQLRGW